MWVFPPTPFIIKRQILAAVSKMERLKKVKVPEIAAKLLLWDYS